MKQPKDLVLLINKIEQAEQWRDNNFKRDWRRYLRQYRSKQKEKQEGSNIFVPTTFMIVETVKSRIANSIFANRPYLTMLPIGDGDSQKAEKIEKLIDWQMNERMRVEREYSGEMLNDLLVLGTTIQYTGWLKKTRHAKRMETSEEILSMNGVPMLDEYSQAIFMPIRQTVEREITVYDDPIVQNIDLFDFFVDSAAADIEESRFCGHKEYLSKSAIENLEETANWQIDWAQLESSGEISGGRDIRVELDGKTLDSSDDDKNGLYLIHHYWEDNRHVVIINNKICVLDEENPFWHGKKPYDKCCYCCLPHEFYGVGIPEMIHGLQEELNTTRNQRIDYNSMALRRMWKVRRGSGISPRDLVWRQNGVLTVNEMDDVQEIQVSDLPASAFANESNIKQDMQDATGCRDVILGLSQTNETATTTMTKDNNASIRFKDVVTAIVTDLLIPLGEKCLELDQQFMSDEKVFRLMDSQPAEIFTISPFELDGDYDVMFTGTAVDPMANKELQKQRMVEVLNVIQNNPLYQQDYNAMTAVLRQFFKAEGFRDYEQMLPQTPQPMMQQPGTPGIAMPGAADGALTAMGGIASGGEI